METDLKTRIRSEKTLNQPIRIAGVPVGLGLLIIVVNLLCLDPLGLYSIVVMIPSISIWLIFKREHKKGNLHYIRRQLLKKNTTEKVYKDHAAVLSHLIKENK